MIDRRAEGARPDMLAADKAKPIDPLLVGQADALVADFIPFSVDQLRPPPRTFLPPAYPKSKMCGGGARGRLPKGRLACTIE
jgi:hypothetical protein